MGIYAKFMQTTKSIMQRMPGEMESPLMSVLYLPNKIVVVDSQKQYRHCAKLRV